MEMETLVATKPARKSKTMWFNVLMALIGVLVEVEQWLAVTTLDVPEWATELVALVIVIGNVGLRMVTDQPVTLSGRPGVKAVPAPGSERPG